MEALPNLASEKFHTDMSCIGIESKTFLTELKLQRYISPGPPNMQKNVVQAVLLPVCESTLPFSSKWVSNFIGFLFASLE